MKKYNELKKCKNGLPTWDSLVPTAVEVIVKNKLLKRRVYEKTIADMIELPEKLRNTMYESNKSKPSIEHRAGFAISLLKLSGLIDYPQKGISEITPLGIELYEKHGSNIDEKILKSQSQFIEHKRLLNERKQRDGNLEEIIEFEANTSGEIEEIIASGVKNHRQVLATELLERMIKAEPVFFEHLVKDLLVAMGYKGGHGNAIVTKASGDGGID